MKLHRFIGNFSAIGGSAYGGDLTQDELVIHEPEFVHQLHTVLRLQKNEELILCDGKGHEARAKILAIDKKFVRVAILSRETIAREPRRQVIAYVAIIKRELFDLIVQKLTEVGVAEIVPIITRRTVKLAIKESRLNSIIREAAEQSGRTTLPLLHAHMEFKKALEHAAANKNNFFFDVSGEARFVIQGASSRVGIFIGPEGGWEDEEVQAAKDAGCTIASLGSLTLRAETAAIVASYLVAAG